MLLNTISNALNTLSEPWWKVFYDFSTLTKGIDEGLRSSMSAFWAVTVEMVIIVSVANCYFLHYNLFFL